MGHNVKNLDEKVLTDRTQSDYAIEAEQTRQRDLGHERVVINITNVFNQPAKTPSFLGWLRSFFL